ncbi:hypothetical protein C2G38_2218921 [Gigaspora rosea]|uniref:SWIM-type domain-containing protein n=1 Tax=Gigaspora rosea TaxID=44941 RepID=A0A397U9J1_9GLOM|nr:hypothetical protein C2G38_2218921 [Gigaspora rosea]
MSKVIPYQLCKLQQIITGREKPEWIKHFKSEWRILSRRPINNTYITNVDQWTCGCLYYLTSRFGICKHLVQQKEPVSSNFFDQIKRNNQPPFLTECDQDLVNVQSITLHNSNESNDNENYNNQSENSDEIYNELITLTTKALTLLEEQKEASNILWARSIKKKFNSINRMVEEVEQYKRKRTLHLTWKGHTHNTRFLN